MTERDQLAALHRRYLAARSADEKDAIWRDILAVDKGMKPSLAASERPPERAWCICGKGVLPENWSNHLRTKGGRHAPLQVSERLPVDPLREALIEAEQMITQAANGPRGHWHDEPEARPDEGYESRYSCIPTGDAGRALAPFKRLVRAALASPAAPETCGWTTRRGDGPVGGPCVLAAGHDGWHSPAAPRPERLDVERLIDILDTMPGLFAGINTDHGLHPDVTRGIAEYVVARLSDTGERPSEPTP